ncbi:DISARM system phospholipase D-like protein DrmC [Cryptosporangium japonicum]|uniref:Phospholipase D-like domain-containing protein n=1 Tax=Cryptosporangium japonicum TaxID=80872 RepID=A0ABP3EMP9_9ACTN
MSRDRFVEAVAAALTDLGPTRLRLIADGIAAHRTTDDLSAAVPVPGFSAVVSALTTAHRDAGLSTAEAAYLEGAATGYDAGTTERAQAVWSGPASAAVPLRATAQVLLDVAAEARTELLLTTYSAKPYPPLLDALRDAVARGVRVDIVVETLQGAGSALNGVEPATAFTAVPQARLWHWPPHERGAAGAKMHAKVAIADRLALLVTVRTSRSQASRRTSKRACSCAGGRPRRGLPSIYGT